MPRKTKLEVFRAAPVTESNFNEKLDDVRGLERTLRGQIQQLLEFGLNHYNENRNSNYLTDIMNAGLSSVRTEAMKEYVESATDLVLKKRAKGSKEMVFKREPFEGYKFQIPANKAGEIVPFWEFSNKGLATPTIEPLSSLDRLLNQIGKASNGEGKKKIAEGKEFEAQAVVAMKSQIHEMVASKADELRAAQ